VAPIATAQADAPAATSIAISSAGRNGSTVDVAGTLTLGADALVPITVADDPSGDSSIPGIGLDLGKVTVTLDLAGNKLVYTVNIFDMLPVAQLQGPPGFGYFAPIMVDGADASLWLAQGNAGGNFPPATAKFWTLCHQAGGYVCDSPITGTIGNGALTWNLPFGKAAISPGSTVEVGTGVLCPGLCTGEWAVVLGNDGPGDDTTLSGYRVPGGVQVGIAALDVPDDQIELEPVSVNKATGAWSGSVAAPSAPGTYRVVATSCWGLLDAPTCATSSTTLTM
jgi:hypothetical protein